jgi:hypothetical protein
MRISLEPEISGGQDTHQNSCNFKYFSVVTVPFFVLFNLFYSIEACYFIASRRMQTINSLKIFLKEEGHK